jgi:hypothetical protein
MTPSQCPGDLIGCRLRARGLLSNRLHVRCDLSDASNLEGRAFPLPHVLRPGEVVESQAVIEGSVIAVTRERLVVAEGDKTVLDIPFGEVRRIQFDIERGREATLVIVPEHISNWPRIVSVPVRHLRETASVLARIGEHINVVGDQQTG